MQRLIAGSNYTFCDSDSDDGSENPNIRQSYTKKNYGADDATCVAIFISQQEGQDGEESIYWSNRIAPKRINTQSESRDHIWFEEHVSIEV